MSSLVNDQRAYGALRTALIGYGVAAFTFFFDRAAMGSSSIQARLLISGVALQILMLALRWFIKRSTDPDVAPRALFILELIGDGLTVMLFALATFGSIAGFAHSI